MCTNEWLQVELLAYGGKVGWGEEGGDPAAAAAGCCCPHLVERVDCGGQSAMHTKHLVINNSRKAVIYDAGEGGGRSRGTAAVVLSVGCGVLCKVVLLMVEGGPSVRMLHLFRLLHLLPSLPLITYTPPSSPWLNTNTCTYKCTCAYLHAYICIYTRVHSNPHSPGASTWPAITPAPSPPLANSCGCGCTLP
jgi:hypothetical protein